MTDAMIDTGTETLLARLEGGVFTLTMNRPEARNALTPEMVESMAAQLEWAERTDAVRCVVLTGAGKGFCSGGDVKAMSDSDQAQLPVDSYIHLQRLAQRNTAGRLYRMPKPTIAAINGAAAGAGLALALACDFRLMSTEAILMTSFAKVGLSGDFGGTYFLSQLIGQARAKELYFLSDRIDAAQALAMGIVNRICEPDALPEALAEIAGRLAVGPAVAFRYIKENLNRAGEAMLEECMDLEATHHVHCMATADHKEAVAAFVAKREPVFTGR